MTPHLKKVIIIITFILLSTHNIFSQTNSTLVLWDSLKTDLKNHLPSDNLEEKFKKFERLITLVETEKNAPLYLEIITAYSFFLHKNRENKKLVGLHPQWEEKFKKFKFDNTDSLALYYRRISINYYVLQLDKESKEYIIKAIDLRQSKNLQPTELAKDYNYLSNIYIVEKDFTNALEVLEKALVITDNDTVKSNLHQNLSLCYRQINDLQESLKHIDLCILLNNKIMGENSVASFVNKLVKAQIQIDLNLLTPAIDALKDIESTLSPIKDTHPEFPETLISCYYYISWGYINLNKQSNTPNNYLELAELYTQKAIDYQIKIASNKPTIFSNYISKCYIAYLQNDAEKLDKAIKESTKILDKNFAGNNKFLGDIAYMKVCYYLLKKDFEKGSMAFQEYLKFLYPTYQPKNNLDFPSKSIIYKNEIAITQLLNNITVFFETLEQAYNNSKDEKFLHKILELIERYEDAIFYVNLNIYKGRLYNNLNINNAYIKHIVYEKGIMAAYILYKKNNDKEYLNLAFNFNEKTKAVNLLKNINTAQTRLIKEIPSSVWDKENFLKTEIVKISNNIHGLTLLPSNKQNITTLLDLQDKLNNTKKEYDKLLLHLEDSYPMYKNIKYNLNFISLNDAQKLLAPQQALISYFIGHNHILIFDIRKDTASLVVQEYLESNLDKSVKSFVNLLNSNKKNTQSLENFATTAQNLYNILIQPLKNLPQRLIIIPDKSLNFLPFETLLAEAPKEIDNLKTYNFLIKQHSFIYNYSVSMLEQMLKPALYNYKYQYAAFAPSFADISSNITSRYGFGHLEGNLKEVYNTSELLNLGTIFEGEKATKENFLKHAQDFRILHLATHGLANHENPDYSLLAFTANTDSIQDAFLYVNDLYNIQLAADLVILSACETNIGNISNGEGILSLARGFSATGAKSLFTTLWKVNDESTATIVQLFFKYLKDGQPKDIALQLAKIEYLEKVNYEAIHPYYWSAYTLIGNPQSITKIENSHSLWIFTSILIISVLGIGSIVYNKKR